MHQYTPLRMGVTYRVLCLSHARSLCFYVLRICLRLSSARVVALCMTHRVSPDASTMLAPILSHSGIASSSPRFSRSRVRK